MYTYFHYDIEYLLSNILIIAICSIGLLSEKKQFFSTRKIVYLYFFIFFGIVPVFEIAYEISYWGGNASTVAARTSANILTAIGIILFYIFSNIKIGIFNITPIKFDVSKKIPIKLETALFFISATSSLFILYLNQENIYQIFFRGIENNSSNNSAEVSVIEFIIRTTLIKPLPALVVIYYWNHSLSNGNNPLNKYGISFIILALIFCSPLSTSRYQAGVLYIAMALAIFRRTPHHSSLILFIIIFGLLFIFPLLDVFRYFSGFTQDGFNLNISYYLQGHFDGHQMFSRVIESEFITYGKQLIGVLFFFIPRSFWPSKPVGSGAEFAEKINLSFSNLSMPFIAEGYVNFGILGVFIFMILLGMFTQKIDTAYWKNTSTNRTALLTSLYYITIGFTFFILRGDLLSSTTYFIGHMIGIFFIHIVATFSLNRRKYSVKTSGVL